MTQRQYLIRYYFEWPGGSGYRHGVMRPRGVYVKTGNGYRIDDRQWWHFYEARAICNRLDALYGDGSHWIIQEADI